MLSYIESNYGRIDVLVLNAGVSGHKGTQLDMEEEIFDLTFSVNVKANFFFTKEALELLKKATDGANVLITSSLSGVYGAKILGVYAMSKASVISMAKWLSVELMDHSIRVNTIAPGFTRTNMVGPELELFEKFFPPKALAHPHEVAAVAAMICAPKDGRFVNGETFVLSGGYTSPKLKFKL